MDQTTPNYGVFSIDAGYTSGYSDYFPGYLESEYDNSPHFVQNDPIYQQIHEPCALPESPPDASIGVLPMSLPQRIPQQQYHHQTGYQSQVDFSHSGIISSFFEVKFFENYR